MIGAGVGTMIFLRNAQLNAVDQSLTQTVTTDIASNLMNVDLDDGEATFTPIAAAPTDFAVAVYSGKGDGRLLAVAGGDSSLSPPEFPSTFSLDQTVLNGTAPFDLASADGTVRYRASVDTLPIPGSRDYYTQLVALPLNDVNRTVANYIGIYTALALFTILCSAVLTRGLVTLAFRGLGQVESTAMTIAKGDFSQRMSDIAPGTEVGRLKTAINVMLDRIDEALGERDSTVERMRRFIGDASHELRTPLVTVRGYAELYRMGAIQDPEQTAQAMERIEKEAIRMGALVEDLLALARLDEQRDIAVVPVDLRPIARDAALDARAAAPDREVTFTGQAPSSAIPLAMLTEPDPASPKRRGGPIAGAGRLLRRRGRADAPPPALETSPIVVPVVPTTPAPIVLGDENRIRQVVANLLGNARRYTPEGSPIELSVGADLETARGWIAVADHGEGIPEQIRAKIFQRFWRADSSRTRETGGSGLGLSIVASIVATLQGTIEVTDTPGGGATFTVWLPLAVDRATAGAALDLATQPLPRAPREDV
ncbi:HAMP domain-containing sensor histidine kinase [Microbacterium sp. KSW4-11]|uniref:histidine kinase n=1 Tax=Microbacterium gawkjiense TaxID=3067309 RepID=A0ABU3GD47_9MICO|nr:HAMP domain-containing sensor histidine kinase [Microbacterium sp. KSW4-11]MDT3317734.1 HAMP domain-containing sensor histidine kinase [Microbacterium sp. KSW4-11]